MKHLSVYNNIFETEAWYFWGNMKVLFGHLDWGLGIEGPHSDQLTKVFSVCVLSEMFLNGQAFC